jgi:hypothetical protein
MLSAIARKTPAAAKSSRLRLQRRLSDARAVLLPVVSQHLIAALGQLGTMLLKASQNGEIALIHHQAAEALDIARASPLLVRRAAALLLGDGPGGDR